MQKVLSYPNLVESPADSRSYNTITVVSFLFLVDVLFSSVQVFVYLMNYAALISNESHSMDTIVRPIL
jgi:hypothetical protein